MLPLARIEQQARLAQAGHLPGSLPWRQAEENAFTQLASERADGVIAQMLDSSRPGIPDFAPNGALPDGVWRASLAGVDARFTGTAERKKLASQLRQALNQLSHAGVRDAFIGGSFVTAKNVPSDVDLLYVTPAANAQAAERVKSVLSMTGARSVSLARAEALILSTPKPSAHHTHRVRGHAIRGESLAEFFRHDTAGQPVGVVHLRLRGPRSR